MSRKSDFTPRTRAHGAPRRAVASDLPRLNAIVGAAYAPYLSRMDRPPAPLAHDLGPDVDAGRVWVVGDPVAGLIVLIAEVDSLLIENVAVAPDAQGSGVGRVLMECAERRARKAGRSRLRLYTNELMTENVAIYSHLGYHEVERRTQDGFRRVFMEKPLS